VARSDAERYFNLVPDVDDRLVSVGRGNPCHYVLADRLSGRTLLQPHHPSSQHRFVQPSSLATLPTGKPLLITRSTASRLKTSGNTRRVGAQQTPSSRRKPSIGVHQIRGGSNVNEMPCLDL